MLLPLLGAAALIAVGGFLLWDRHRMAIATIEGILRGRHARGIHIAPVWFDFDRDTMTYDVEFTDGDGRRRRVHCKVAVRPGADESIYWSPSL